MRMSVSRRTSVLLSGLAACLVTLEARAQSALPATAQVAALPAPMALTAIPSTPAGKVLRAWLEAFNSGDSTRIADFIRDNNSRHEVGEQMRFRKGTGGFDLLSITRSEPRTIGIFVKERGGQTTAVGTLTLPAAGGQLDGPDLQALGPNVALSSIAIDDAARARVVAGAALQLDSFYVFPDVARRMGDAMRARLAAGAYDSATTGPAFADLLDRDLAAVSHDKHLHVRYSARVLPPSPPVNLKRTALTPAQLAERRKEMDEENCGFDKVERLDGNIGYLKLDGFFDTDVCGPTADAAMTLLAGTKALIIDLRENGGGKPAMVAHVASYLFDTRTHLNDLWIRHSNTTDEFWTSDTLPGRRFGSTKPVYVLTASHTFSGGEELTYDLQALKRATIVGETTGGGAHPVRPRGIDQHFSIGVPFARPINPTTKTDWEGVGVEPDVKVPAADALATALRMAREAVKP